MQHLSAPLFTLFQASLGGVGLLLLVPLLWIPITRWRGEPRLRERVVWLLLSPLPWIALSYWTSFHPHQAGAPFKTPQLASQLLLLSVIATLVIAVCSVVLNPGARRFFAAWGLVNLWFAAVGALLCAMATSGQWV